MGLLDIFRVSSIKKENEELKEQVHSLNSRIDALGVTEYEQTKALIDKVNEQIASGNSTIRTLSEEISQLKEKSEKLSKNVTTQERKINRCKELYKSVDYAINNFLNTDVPYSDCKISSTDFQDLDLVTPSVILNLHCMDVKDLRAAYRDNEKQINKLLDSYSARYTTKANKAIYNLMVIALRAELQNILYSLKYEKLEKAIDDVKKVSAKYLRLPERGIKACMNINKIHWRN